MKDEVDITTTTMIGMKKLRMLTVIYDPVSS